MHYGHYRSVTAMLEIELGSRSRNIQNLLFSLESESQASDQD